MKTNYEKGDQVAFEWDGKIRKAVVESQQGTVLKIRIADVDYRNNQDKCHEIDYRDLVEEK